MSEDPESDHGTAAEPDAPVDPGPTSAGDGGDGHDQDSSLKPIGWMNDLALDDHSASQISVVASSMVAGTPR
jgi:hypothetical protein